VVRTLAIVTVIATFALAGCADGALRRHDGALLNEYLPYAGPPVDSFHFFHLDSWEAVGPYQVVIWTTPWDAYFVTVQSPCNGLAFANRLAVTSTVGSISKFESIVLRHDERCPILEIRPLDLKQMKADRAAERTAAQRAE